MDLIIGGAYQGKLDYAKERFQLCETDIFTCTESIEIDFSKRCIYHLEEFVLACVGAKTESVGYFERCKNLWQDSVVICEDISCGVVPVDMTMRLWREAVGRLLNWLSPQAETVTRVFCGLPQELIKKKKIHLIRHGMTEANEKWLYCGATDIPLSEAGKTGLKKLKELSDYPDISGCRIFTSGMLRTEQTLEVLYGETPHTELPELREMDFGAFEMNAYEELKTRPDYLEWLSGDNEKKRCPGGESGADMTARVLRGFSSIIEKDGDALIVAHGGVIAAIMLYLFPDEVKSRYEWQPESGKGYTIVISKGTQEYMKIPENKPRCAVAKEHGQDWRGKAYSFFQNTACEYFPCHKTDDPENFNCLFCYCPLYALGDKCGGNYTHTKSGHKDCSKCLVPHKRENYGYIISRYSE